MSKNCSCSGEESGFREFDETALASLKEFAAKSASQDATTQTIWMLGNQLCPVQGTADGKQGCVTVPFLGIPVKLCWEILELDPIPPAVSAKIKISISVAGTQFLSVVLLMKCESIANPSSCTIEIENDLFAVEALRPSCDWACLKSHAPSCASNCKFDYWCWARCAAGAVLHCCRLW